MNRASLPLSLLRASSRLSSLREVAIVLCRRDCSQLIPSQGTAHVYREQLGPVTDPGRCGRIWCEFLTAKATPTNATCCWPRPLLTQAAASTDRTELAPTGGISSCHRTTPIEQPGRSVLPHPPLCFVRFDGLFLATTIPPTWAEGRALLRSNPSAVPGANTEWGGTMPPSSIRDWHRGAKSPGLRPPGGPAPTPLSALLFLPFVRSCPRDGPALGVDLPLAQHVPDDRGQLAHHRDA